jgi:opacity protein-like surface antigen
MKRVTLVAVFLLLVSGIAFAGDTTPKMEVFGGYAYFNCDTGDSDLSCNLNGWDLSAAFNANSYMGIVADFGGVYGREAGEAYIDVHSYLFGPKFAFRKEKVTPFAQALFGAATFGNSENVNAFAMTLGGGLDFDATEKMAIRLAQVEYFLTRNNDVTSHNFRYSAGIVFKLGEK